MKWLKSYAKYMESVSVDMSLQSVDLMESLNVWHDALLDSIDAQEVDMFETFHLAAEDYRGKMDLDFLDKDVEFLNSLSSIALKKSEVQKSDYFETFLDKPCKFMFVYGAEKNELENPEYLLFQSWLESLDKWEDVKLYKVVGDVQRFYEKLSSKTIEVIDGEDTYIYSASNVNDWVLKNIEKENDIYKKILRKEELQKLLSDRKLVFKF